MTITQQDDFVQASMFGRSTYDKSSSGNGRSTGDSFHVGETGGPGKYVGGSNYSSEYNYKSSESARDTQVSGSSTCCCGLCAFSGLGCVFLFIILIAVGIVAFFYREQIMEKLNGASSNSSNPVVVGGDTQPLMKEAYNEDTVKNEVVANQAE